MKTHRRHMRRAVAVEGVPHAIAEEIDGKNVSDRKRPGTAGCRCDLDQAPGLGHDVAPARDVPVGVPAPMNDRMASVIIAEAQI